MKHINELRLKLEEDEDWGVYDGVLSRADIIFEIIPTSIGEFVTAWCYGKEIDLSEV